MKEHAFNRRDVLRLGAIGTSLASVAGAVGFLPWSSRAQAANIIVNYQAVAGDVRMVNNSYAHMLTFSSSGAPEFPGATILCQEGDTVTVTLTNTLTIPIVFALHRTAVRESVNPGASRTFSFAAPPAGSYLYCDDQNNGVNRVLGLHGALVSMPQGIADRPYVDGPQFVRQYKWLFATVDPAWGNTVRNNHSAVATINPNSYKPRYFTINGKSYPDTHHDHDCSPMGMYHEAAYIRVLNAGGMIHSPHFHGNHVKIITENHLRHAASNWRVKDIVSMYPLDVKDVLLPFEPPPDAWPPITTEEQHFPMHDHCEPSQTANGGSYPSGSHVAIHFGAAPHHEPHL